MMMHFRNEKKGGLPIGIAALYLALFNTVPGAGS